MADNLIIQVDSTVPDYLSGRMISEAIVSDENLLNTDPVEVKQLWTYPSDTLEMTKSTESRKFTVYNKGDRGFIKINVPKSYNKSVGFSDDVYIYKMSVKGNLPVRVFLNNDNNYSTIPSTSWSTYGIVFRGGQVNQTNTINISFNPTDIGDTIEFSSITLHKVSVDMGLSDEDRELLGSAKDTAQIIYNAKDKIDKNTNEIVTARKSIKTGKVSSTLQLRLNELEEGIDITDEGSAIQGTRNDVMMSPRTTSVAISKQSFKGIEGSTIQYIAHRGNTSDFPENTAVAIEGTTKHWGVEIDTRVTSDGEWIIMHDTTVDRMTNGSGNVASTTLSKLKSYNINAGNNRNKLPASALKVPTLREALISCRKAGVVPVIEIKKPTITYTKKNYDDFVKLLRLFDYLQSCIIISFELSILKEIKNRIPYITMQYLVNSIDDKIINDTSNLGINTGIDVKQDAASFTESNVLKARDKGLSVGCWTVPDNRFKNMENIGVDYITTNSPSGNLRYERITRFLNKVVPYVGSDVMNSCYVEEIAKGVVHLRLIVKDGTKQKNKMLIATIPDWAIPQGTSWGTAMWRTKTGVGYGSADVTGYGHPDKGKVLLSLAGIGTPADRTTWLVIDNTYRLHG